MPTAILLGATGETGKAVLAAAGANLKCITRKDIPNASCAVYADFSTVPVSAFHNCSTVYCAMGTTRAKAGSASAFRRTEHDLVLDLAAKCKQAGVATFHYVSSIGANPRSYFLYPATKGKVEAGLAALNFERLFVYRPGILLCERAETRRMEAISRSVVAPALDFVFPHKYSVSTDTLAKAMLRATDAVKESKVLENRDIVELAGSL